MKIHECFNFVARFISDFHFELGWNIDLKCCIKRNIISVFPLMQCDQIREYLSAKILVPSLNYFVNVKYAKKNADVFSFCNFFHWEKFIKYLSKTIWAINWVERHFTINFVAKSDWRQNWVQNQFQFTILHSVVNNCLAYKEVISDCWHICVIHIVLWLTHQAWLQFATICVNFISLCI